MHRYASEERAVQNFLYCIIDNIKTLERFLWVHYNQIKESTHSKVDASQVDLIVFTDTAYPVGQTG